MKQKDQKHVLVDEDVHTKLKILSVKKKITIGDVIKKLLKKEL